MPDVEKLRKRRDQLNAQIQAELNKQAQRERKGRNHAIFVLGGLLEQACGGNWKTIDYAKLAACVTEHADEFSECTCPERPLTQANKRLRAWERDRVWDNGDE